MTIPLVCLLLAFTVSSTVLANHNSDLHSDNMTLVGRFDDGGTYREGTDLAFWKDRAVLGNQDPGGFRLLDISQPTNPRQLGQFECGGDQNDVSIWKDLVIVSVDSPMAGPECGAEPADSQEAWEGIRLVSVADPAHPVQIAALHTPCGSHTHTLVSDLDHRDVAGNPAPRLVVYVNSGPSEGEAADCVAGQHRRVMVVEVPLDDPPSAHIVAQLDVSPADGCHDMSVLLDRRTDPLRRLAGAACFTESQLWDISDPVQPKILAHITNPRIDFHHSAAFDWEGETLVLGDEPRSFVPGCLEDDLALGALWFYDVSDPSNPQLRGHFVIPQRVPARPCSAHYYNVVPLRDGRDVLVSSWYRGGTTVVDFTDAANPQQLAFYIPVEDGPGIPYSSYWYNGLVYANNLTTTLPPDPGSRGLDVFKVDHPALAGAVKLQHLNPQTQERPPRVID